MYVLLCMYVCMPMYVCMKCMYAHVCMKSKSAQISESDTSRRKPGHQKRLYRSRNLSQVNTIGCADEGLWIFSLEDSMKRQHTVNWEDQSWNKTEEHELMIDSGCFGTCLPTLVCTAISDGCVLEFEHTVIFATFVKYVQKTTSPIRLGF